MGQADKPDASGRRQWRWQTSQTTQCWPPGLTLLLGLLLSASIVQTGPVIRSRRMIREIYVENSPAAPEGASVEASGDSGDGSPAADFVASDMCLHDGAYVERSAISCEKKHGCRAIQKTGECCADFQCECQRDGKTYANGEKLFDPNTPCRSCYCQGGEVTCSEVSCYKRNDCDPKYIPGRCCPEYDNCPPLEHFKLTESGGPKESAGVTSGQETNEVNGNHAAEPPLAASEATDLAAGHQKIQQPQTAQQQQQEASASSSTATPATTTTGPTAVTATAVSNDNPLGIKIKEITKPEEIRLTDNRPAPTPEPATSQSEELVNLEHLDVNVPDDDGGNGTKIVRHTPDGDSMRSEVEEPPKSTSAENRVESYESSTGGTVSESDEWLDVKEQSESSAWSTTPSAVASVSSTTPVPSPAPSTSDPTPDRNEDSDMKPAKPDNGLPAVVQIGDKLVIVDHNQPKPITVIQVEEVEGLQRGEDDNVYDQEMYTERSPAATETGRESSKKLNLHQPADSEQETLSTQADSSGSYETVWHGGSTELVGVSSSEEVYDTQLYTEGPEDAASNDTNTSKSGEQDTVSKEDFLHMNPSQEPAKIVKAEHTISSTTTSSSEGSSYGSSEEGSTSLADLSTSLSPDASGDGMIFETQFYTEGPGTSSEEVKWQGATEDPTANETATASASYPTRDPVPVADELVTHGKTYIEDDEHDLIQPGFQPIPEDFSLAQHDQPSHDMMIPDEIEHGSGSKQEKILSEVLELTRKNATTTDRPDEAVEPAEEGSPAVAESGSIEETSNSPAWLKEDPKPQSRAPGEPLLVPEWERSNTTSGNSSSSASEEQELESGSGEHQSGAVLKVGSEEEGSGEESSTTEMVATSAAPLKAEGHSEREQDDEEQDKLEVGSASARSAQDIDSVPPMATTADEQSDSVKHNPKNDVESLKYDENENDATADEAIPKKVQQLEVSVLEAFRGLPSPALTSV
ncbi:uncharacterized protein LOC131207915 [Anopheles bellator]|uniref:uncharacterized protein LOC131207915 n=1 Tax=Anopheles bellator TaxID=139047 RepID=UPI0026470190|nr:uncharacterized protein LOC131207915 [Anopheles bellator]